VTRRAVHSPTCSVEIARQCVCRRWGRRRECEVSLSTKKRLAELGPVHMGCPVPLMLARRVSDREVKSQLYFEPEDTQPPLRYG
jgi:hypothetical protein